MNKSQTHGVEDIVQVRITDYLHQFARQTPSHDAVVYQGQRMSFQELEEQVITTDDGGKYGLGEVVAELDITPDLWFFGCHFRNDPVMPGCLGLDVMWQLVGFFLGWKGFQGRGRARGGEIKFNGTQAVINHF